MSPLGQAPRRLLWLICLLAFLGCATALSWFCRRSDAIAFLPGGSGAEWLVAPMPAQPMTYRGVPLVAKFRATLVLDHSPSSAVLQFCAFKSAAVLVNNHLVATTSGKGWKAATSAEVARRLHPGTNVLCAWVTNGLGPPAVWMRLQVGTLCLGTDARWEAAFVGEAWQPARPANYPLRSVTGTGFSSGLLSVHWFSRAWPALLAMMVVSMGTVLATQYWLHRRLAPLSNAPPPARHPAGPHHHQAGNSLPKQYPDRPIYILLGLVMLLRLALLINNLPQLPQAIGFDAVDHAQYIQHLQTKASLPLASDGWEMYQPPLYYGLSAVVLSACGLSLPDDPAGLAARWLNGVLGLIHCWLALLCLRLLFPGQRTGQAIGLLVAAFLPPHLYLSQFITNEPLAGVLVTLALYCGLRILLRSQESLALYLALGAALGAAALAKVSAVLALPVFLTMLGLRLAGQKRWQWADWTRGPGVVLLAFLMVCGWFYGRNWVHFGRPLVGNWDADIGSPWWQDPGFRTSSFYAEFGHSLTAPVFSSADSFADGLYSTLWGDSMLSGAGTLAWRPPWNYELMHAGYFLALGLSAVVLVGVCTAGARILRHCDLNWFLVGGLVSAFAFGILYMSLRVPSYAEVKAFYGFPALVPFCALLAAGYEWLQQKQRWLGQALWVLVVVWSLTACSTLWVRRSNAETHQLRGLYLSQQDREAEAVASLTRALELQPNLPEARSALGELLAQSGNLAAAAGQFQATLKLDPDNASAHYNLGCISLRQQRNESAVAEFREALRLRPYWAPPTLDDMVAFLAAHPSPAARENEQTYRVAETACRLALRFNPDRLEAHQTLALVLRLQNRPEEARLELEAARKL